jgi:hypothetical protein
MLQRALEPHLVAEVGTAGGGPLDDRLAGLLPEPEALGALGVEAQEELLVAATFAAAAASHFESEL